MRKILAISAAAGLMTAVPAVAYAQTHAARAGSPVTCNADWYVNPDETARMPIQKPSGMVFQGDQLVHHKPVTPLPLEGLHHGDFLAFPPPSLSSFFSVEVGDPTTKGYATLRWDTTANEWVLGGTDIMHASAKDFIGATTKWGELTENTRVISFGVGYVEHPNNGTRTRVTQVWFAGHHYSLACKPHNTPTPTPTPTDTATATPSPTPTASTPPGEAPAPTPVKTNLPVTG